MTDPLPRVRDIALSLPEATERPSHGQPTFFAAGKQFAQVRLNHHGDGLTVVCVRTSGSDEQAMLIETDPAIYSRPAYLGPAGWISMHIGDGADWELIADRVQRSWALAAPKRLQERSR